MQRDSKFDYSARRARQGVPWYWTGRWVSQASKRKKRRRRGSPSRCRAFLESRGCAGHGIAACRCGRRCIVVGESVHVSWGQVCRVCVRQHTRVLDAKRGYAVWMCTVPRRWAGNLEKRAGNNGQSGGMIRRVFMVNVHVIRYTY